MALDGGRRTRVVSSTAAPPAPPWRRHRARPQSGRDSTRKRPGADVAGRCAMVDPVLLFALALAAGAPLALSPVVTALGAALVAAALRRRLGGAALAAATAALLVGGWRARMLLDDAAHRYGRDVDLLQPPARCEVSGVVLGSPIVVGAAQRPAGEAPSSRIDVELTDGACGERALVEPLRARLYGAPVDLARGDRLAIVADLAPVHLFRNDGLRDATAAIARSGVTASGTIVDARRSAEGRSIGA